MTSLRTNGTYEFEGPDDRDHTIQFWTDRYLPFERLDDTHLGARAELRKRLRSLIANPHQILAAAFSGPRPANSDVENVLLYNIDTGGRCFAASAINGVRFELASPRRPSERAKRAFACLYEYRLINPGDESRNWKHDRELAAFNNISLGKFPSGKRLAQVWFALRTSAGRTTSGSTRPGESYGVYLALGVPATASCRVAPELVKPLIDGTVSAFQFDAAGQPDEVAARIGESLGQSPSTVRKLLVSEEMAALGPANPLVRLFGKGVQWNPSDHLCVFGQIVLGVSQGTDYTLPGRVVALRLR
jgi:hypothetical protein